MTSLRADLSLPLSLSLSLSRHVCARFISGRLLSRAAGSCWHGRVQKHYRAYQGFQSIHPIFGGHRNSDRSQGPNYGGTWSYFLPCEGVAPNRCSSKAPLPPFFLKNQVEMSLPMRTRGEGVVGTDDLARQKLILAYDTLVLGLPTIVFSGAFPLSLSLVQMPPSAHSSVR